ncbi:ABC transporter ATP-binding protein [Paenarthrobacter sp. DKR-5]|uniref:ABC transporter ATP-binding protein n=1 Tax=Paenarthrobacter sp. DKR-5 TaxID=2835535 RepID=UPI001BDBF4D6|nr:ABC transporter ATP-binding protein [Paenarthrobacter sp. DKR-5]MBT1004271.1 ABC transporter ATP-binding protein [Paenarthrobacter sp. DKR-5]
MKISIQNLQLKYGSFTAIENLNLDIEDGEALVLLGQSGCGKTSTMRCIAGLEEPTSGRIIIDDIVVFDSEKGINLPPNKRNVGMVFQSYAVWPHMTVAQNVAYSLKRKKLATKEIDERVTEALTLVGLDQFAERGASLLSGGQMQRVALARSLVMRPSVLMLDEPLSNLDARLRDRLRVELREIQLKLGLTCVYVTHDQHEAFALADRIALLQGGRIVQMGAPRHMYEAPASASIAHFLGVSNIMECTEITAADGQTAARIAASDLTIHATQPPAQAALSPKVCIRAEDLQVTAAPTGSVNSWPGTVRVAGFQGNDVRYAVELEAGPELDVLGGLKRGEQHNVGDRVWVTVNAREVQILPAEVFA